MGQFFGERALVDVDENGKQFMSKRNATIRAVDYCELLILMKTDFDTLRKEALGEGAVEVRFFRGSGCVLSCARPHLRVGSPDPQPSRRTLTPTPFPCHRRPRHCFSRRILRKS